MSRRVLLFSGLFMILLGVMPLAATAHDGPWHVPIRRTGAGPSANPDVVISAKLTEYTIALDPAQPQIKVGQHVLFVIQNRGKLDHEFMIMSTAMAGMKMGMKQMDAMSVATVEPDQLHPGATAKLTVVFKEPGTCEIACHLPGHEAMKTSIAVSA